MKVEFYMHKGRPATLKRICEEEKKSYRSVLKKTEMGYPLWKALKETKTQRHMGRKPIYGIEGLSVKQYCKNYNIQIGKGYKIAKILRNEQN